VNDHRIPLECCPSSNVQTGAVRDLASHPLKLYFNLGLRVTVNTDNRLVTNTTVSKELWLCHTQMGMTFRDVKSMIMAGFKSSFLPFHERQNYLRRVGQELARFDDEGNPRTPSSHSALSTSAISTERGERPHLPSSASGKN
jgi:adenosine deaminase